MDKFWKWMRDGGYCRQSEGTMIAGEAMNLVEPTKQMLIGYMFEYLSYIRISIGTLMESFSNGDINDLYAFLKKRIEGI